MLELDFPPLAALVVVFTADASSSPLAMMSA